MANNDDAPKTPPAAGGAPSLRVKVKTSGIKGRFAALRPASPRTRWLLLGAAIAVGGIIFSTMTASGPSKAPPPAKQQHFINVTPNGAGAQTWQAQSQGKVEALQSQLGALQNQVSGLKQAMQAQTQALQSATESLQTLHNTAGAPTKAGTAPEKSNLGSLPLPPPPPPVPVSSLPQMPAAPGNQILEYSPSTPAGKSAVASRTDYAKNKYAGYIPVGSFMPVVLLNGVDAGTSSQTQSNPQPILVRIQGNAILPGSARYQLKSCFVLMSAYGNLSAQRVYGRAAELSCVDQDDHLVLNQPIKGYLVDSDGVLGLRGKVINRQGALLARALLAGFASGLGQALTNAQGTMSSSALGAVQTVSGSRIMSQGAYSGAGNAANLLAQFYLKQAQSIFPVVAVRAGRKATLVITNGESLTWHDYGSLYAKEVTPQK
ncbi:TraB/VirB10 family protein [Thiomonas sp.]